MEADDILAHRRARDNHDKQQTIHGLRHAAHILGREENQPKGVIQCQTITKVKDKLLENAKELEQQL